MILVDTSVWIDFFAGRDLPHVAKLEQSILDNENLTLSGTILTEILQGIADDTLCRRVRRYLSVLVMLPMPESVFVRAAELYRKLPMTASLQLQHSNINASYCTTTGTSHRLQNITP